MPRLFIALPVPEKVVRRLQAVQNLAGEGWRWMRPETIHLTLVFLGNVDESQVAVADQGIRRACDEYSPLQLTATGLGAFPSKARATVLWAGVGGDVEGLRALQSRLRSELRTSGFAIEDRDYRPHITLARSRTPRRLPDGLDRSAHFGEWLAREVTLFESQLVSGGARHVVRANVALS